MNLGARDPVVKLDVDADRADRVDLGQCELCADLVSGDSERVEAAGDRARLEDHDSVAEASQGVRTAQAGRARADHRDPLPRRGPGCEEIGPRIRSGGVAGMTLEPADLDRRLQKGL